MICEWSVCGVVCSGRKWEREEGERTFPCCQNGGRERERKKQKKSRNGNEKSTFNSHTINGNCILPFSFFFLCSSLLLFTSLWLCGALRFIHTTAHPLLPHQREKHLINSDDLWTNHFSGIFFFIPAKALSYSDLNRHRWWWLYMCVEVENREVYIFAALIPSSLHFVGKAFDCEARKRKMKNWTCRNKIELKSKM